MSRGQRVGLVFGGSSVEHEVSVTSARGVARAMAQTSLECVPLAVTGQGRWLSPELSGRLLHGEASRAEPTPESDDGVRLGLVPGGRRLVRITEQRGAGEVELDVLFPLIHGWGGEDGRLQGALEQVGLPYVGSGVLGSAVAMDKAAARMLLEAHGIEAVPWLLLRRATYEADRAAAIARIGEKLDFPVFVKPANGGSSVGITKAHARDELASALAEAFDCDRRVVVEQGVEAREIECAVLGNERPEASVAGEIVPSREFYDYAAKYLDAASELVIPAELEPGASERIRGEAVRAFLALDLAGLARVDFLVERSSGKVFLNEVNTLPGFTPISMYPKLWEASGVSYPRLIERLVALGLERAREEARRRFLRDSPARETKTP